MSTINIVLPLHFGLNKSMIKQITNEKTLNNWFKSRKKYLEYVFAAFEIAESDFIFQKFHLPDQPFSVVQNIPYICCHLISDPTIIAYYFRV